MKIITINLPEKYLDAIQTLNDLGAYPSRSEAIRVALHNFLAKEVRTRKDLEKGRFKMIIQSKLNKSRG